MTNVIENLEERLLKAAFDYGYFDAMWNHNGNNRSYGKREYIVGQGDLLAEMYSNTKFYDCLDNNPLFDKAVEQGELEFKKTLQD
jgi:hypothetical protein